MTPVLIVISSIIAIFDSIASRATAKEIDFRLRSWIHHKANNPYDGALNIKSIAPQVRLLSLVIYSCQSTAILGSTTEQW
jgi:hypothetical protein